MMLHLTFHQGCANVIKSLFPDAVTQLVTSGTDGFYYNMTADRSEKAWLRWGDWFNKFDTIIVSDTIPLSRILLDRYQGNIILWLTNRMDYWDTKDEVSEIDSAYYELISKPRQNVTVLANNYFDKFYAEERGLSVKEVIKSATPPHPKKEKVNYYIPIYWNDNLLNMAEKVKVPFVTGRYQDGELDSFKAVIHIPYTWSSIALYDALAAGVPYYVPTQRLLLELLKTENFWFQNANYCKKYLGLCEFYREENSKFVFYFDSFDAIKELDINYDEIYGEADKIYHKNSAKWQMLI
jgi:hypothetical protein